MRYLAKFNQYLLDYRTYKTRKLIAGNRSLAIDMIKFKGNSVDVNVKYVGNDANIIFTLIYTNDVISSNISESNIELILSYFFGIELIKNKITIVDYLKQYQYTYYQYTIIGDGGLRLNIEMAYQIFDYYQVKATIINTDGIKSNLTINIDQHNRFGCLSIINKTYSDEHHQYLCDILAPFFNVEPID